MSRDKAIGGGLLALSVVVIIAYLWLVFFPPLTGADIFVLKLTGAVAVIVVFAIIGWIGYTLATTPPPKPIEEIEKELEEALEKVEKEVKEEKQQKGKRAEKLTAQLFTLIFFVFTCLRRAPLPSLNRINTFLNFQIKHENP